MATVADELLNDFEDSGSEGEEEGDQNGFNDDIIPPVSEANGLRKPSDTGLEQGDMELDDDEEEIDDEMEGGPTGAADEPEDEEEAKARVEKLQLGGVNDVRSVASLMKTLDPILEVSKHHTPLNST